MTVFSFERCELDIDRVELRVGGRPLAVEPQVFEVLALLVRRRHRLVPKEELLDEVWHHRFVTESALSSRIKSARRAIGDDGRAQRLIRTVHGRGYQFVGEVEERAEPPAASRATPVPRPATPTIGRAGDIDAVVDLLARSRIVTLLGPGGVGKTRLAAEAVLRLTGTSPVESCFVDLTKVRGAELVPHLVVRELGIRAGAASDAGAVVEDALGNRPYLLVLDNFEHVVEAAGFVAGVVRACAGLHVLVTSRARLRIAGEHVFDVSPLSVDPEGDGLGDAVALFAQAATAVDGTFRLEPNLADVVTICRTVDGLPLAIELAAGHLRTLPPSLLRTRLGARLGSSGAAARDAPARQQTVPATIDWSLQLLGSPEQRLFARLGVFSGPVPLEAVEEVCGDDRLEVVEALSRLVDQSLVRRVPGRAGEARFVLLELLRERARELLAAQDGDAVARRHAAWVATWVEQVEVRRWTDAAGWWVEALTELLSEIRAAHAWAGEHGETEPAIRITAAIGNLWHREGGQDEGRRWVAEALATAAGRDDEVGGRLHLSAGWVAWAQSELAARRHWEAATEIFRRLGHDRYLAYGLNLTAATYIGDGAHHQHALALCDEATALARRVGELPLLASTLNVKGELARVHGDHAAARAAYDEAYAVAVAMGDDQHIAMLLGCLSFLADHAGDHAEARRLASDALRLSWSAGRRATAAESLVQVAGPELGLGHPDRAARLLGASEEALRVLGGHIAQGDAPELARLVAGLDAALAPEDLDRLRAEGARLSLEAAVEEALTPP